MSLISVTEYKQYADIDYSDEDTVLQSFVERATGMLEDFCNRGLTANTRTEVYDGSGTDVLRLRSKPVTDVASVEYATGVSGGSQVWDTLGTGSYYSDDAEGVLYRVSGIGETTRATIEGDWVRGKANYRVTYTGGEATATLKQAACELVDMLYANRRRNQSLSSESVGISWNSLSVAEQMEWFKLKVGSYRRIRF